MRLVDTESPVERQKELDTTDVRLIGELVADGRASFAALSDRVGLSPAAVRTRVQSFIADHTITVSARVDARSAGAAVVEFALITVSRSAEAVAAAMQDVDEAVFVACVTGPWGIVAEIRCDDKSHLLDTYDRLRAVPGIIDLEALPLVEYFKQDWSGLAEELTEHRASDPALIPRPSRSPLDKIDERIVGELLRNGRITFADLASKVGLSPAAARARAQRLLNERVVIIQTLVSQRVLGRGAFAGVLLSARRGAVNLAERLTTLHESTLVAVTSGRYEVVCELWSRDSVHLLRTLDRIRSFDEVSRAECYPYLDIAKETYGIAH